MEVHRLVTLPASALLDETGVASFDLDTASCLLLDMLDVSASVTDYLCSEIETLDRL